MSTLRPIPEGFTDSTGLPIHVLARKYSAGSPTVRRWLEEAGITRRLTGGPTIKARPDDFATFQAGRKTLELAAHYGVCKAVVQRWLREIGISRGQTAAAAGARTRRDRSTSVRRPEFNRAAYAMSPKVERGYREDSAAGAAADYLRAFYTPVYRCDAEGRQNVHGRFWRCGRLTINDAEIIERAASVRARRERQMAA